MSLTDITIVINKYTSSVDSIIQCQMRVLFQQLKRYILFCDLEENGELESSKTLIPHGNRTKNFVPLFVVKS